MCCPCSQNPLDLSHLRDKGPHQTLTNAVIQSEERNLALPGMAGRPRLHHAPGRRSWRAHSVGRNARVADMKPNVGTTRDQDNRKAKKPKPAHPGRVPNS